MRHPPLKYHGSKFKLASWYASLAPASYRTRVITCAGGLGEILGCHDWPIDGVSEVVNDWNLEVSEFWQVMADAHNFKSFKRIAEATPFSQTVFDMRHEYKKSLYIAERAFGFFIEQRMGSQGSQAKTAGFATPVLSRTRRGLNENVSAWLTAVDGLPEVHERLKRVEVRRESIMRLISQYDHPDTFFFIDPPYLAETRTGGVGQYANEWTEADHVVLLDGLAQIRGKFLLCGYPTQMYTDYAVEYNWSSRAKYVTKSSSRAAEKPSEWEKCWTNYVPT